MTSVRFKRYAAPVLWALLAALSVYVLCSFSVSAVSASDVRFDSGEWISLEQVSGSHTVEIEQDCVNVSVGTLLCPGANGTLRVRIVNGGQKAVKLSLTNSVLRAEAPLQIELSSDPLGDEPITLAPGGDCFLTVTVRWDSESTATDVDVDGSFAITLSYEGGEVVIGDGPKTGDASGTWTILLAATSLIAIILIQKRKNRAFERD